jgi:acetyl-CoA carboxylase carboxyltransferase component
VDLAIEIGVVDEKIDPAHTRSKITQALAEAHTGAVVTRTSRCNFPAKADTNVPQIA